MGIAGPAKWAALPMARPPGDRSVLINEQGGRTDAPAGSRERAMSRYERRIFFDRLVELREAYQSTEHDATSMTAKQAIAYAIGLLDHPARLEAILAESSADGASQLHTA
jgi:hypothetical protein